MKVLIYSWSSYSSSSPGHSVVLRLVGLILYPLLVLIILYLIIELALGKSLRLLGNSQEVLIFLLLPAYTRLQCGRVLVGCVLFSTEFVGCS